MRASLFYHQLMISVTFKIWVNGFPTNFLLKRLEKYHYLTFILTKIITHLLEHLF